MSVESVVFNQDLNASNPPAGDALGEGDNHMRNLKIAGKTLCEELVGTANFAASASVETYALIGAFVAGYDYRVVLENLYGSAAGAPRVRVTTGGGVADAVSTYETARHSVTTGGGTSTTYISFSDGVGDAADETGFIEFLALNPQGVTNPRHILFTKTTSVTTATIVHEIGCGMYRATTAVDGLQIIHETGGATLTGTLKIYRRFRPT